MQPTLYLDFYKKIIAKNIVVYFNFYIFEVLIFYQHDRQLLTEI